MRLEQAILSLEELYSLRCRSIKEAPNMIHRSSPTQPKFGQYKITLNKHPQMDQVLRQRLESAGYGENNRDVSLSIDEFSYDGLQIVVRNKNKQIGARKFDPIDICLIHFHAFAPNTPANPEQVAKHLIAAIQCSENPHKTQMDFVEALRDENPTLMTAAMLKIAKDTVPNFQETEKIRAHCLEQSQKLCEKNKTRSPIDNAQVSFKFVEDPGRLDGLAFMSPAINVTIKNDNIVPLEHKEGDPYDYFTDQEWVQFEPYQPSTDIFAGLDGNFDEKGYSRGEVPLLRSNPPQVILERPFHQPVQKAVEAETPASPQLKPTILNWIRRIWPG